MVEPDWKKWAGLGGGGWAYDLQFNTGNSNLEPLLEGLLVQIHMDLCSQVLGRNRTRDLRMTHISVRCHARIH